GDLPAQSPGGGRAAGLLVRNVASPKSPATTGLPIAVDAALAATLAEPFPPESVALPTTVLVEVSTNCTLPVGVPLAGAAADTTPVSVSCPATNINAPAVVVEACCTVTVTCPFAADHVASPLYCAVIVCVPNGRVPMLIDAAPDVRVAVPRGVPGPNGFAPGMEKTTCPVGAANPAGTLIAPTLAVRVTVCPNTGLVGAAVTVIVTAAFTACP